MRKILGSIACWVAVDGLLHIETSFGIVVVARCCGCSHLGATAVALAFGIGKEIYDKFAPGHSASWHDIICDLVGIAIGNLCTP